MNKKLYKLMNWPQIEAIVYCEESNPYTVLGAKTIGTGTLYQAFFPGALECSVEIMTGKTKAVHKMELADEIGFFAAIVSGKPSSYEYIVKYENEEKHVKDAYSFSGYEIYEKDSKLFTEGALIDTYRILGAHPMKVKNVPGVKFALWAPNAVSVGISGDFNNWDGRTYIMKKNDASGIFELFIPDVKEGAKYKYLIKVKGGKTYLKNDPYAFEMDVENDCSVVRAINNSFDDEAWIKGRKSSSLSNKPISICEVKPTAETISGDAKKYSDAGFTHIELMPIMEYDNVDSQGYETKGFYAVGKRAGGIDAVSKFINDAHKAGLGIILDYPIFHFPDEGSGLADFDGTCLYEHLDPRKGIHPFYGTKLFNYGRPEVKEYLISNALFLIDKFHIDGIKLCGTSSMLYLDYGRQNGEWISNIYGGNENLEAIEFIKELNSAIKKKHPEVMLIAEEESGYPKTTDAVKNDGLGFDFKLNSNFVADQIDYMSFDPYFRAHHHNALTFSMVYQYSEKFISALSHDLFMEDGNNIWEKMPGEEADKLNNLKLLIAYIMLHPGKKLINESLLETEELSELIKALNDLYKGNGSLYEKDEDKDGFEWINSIDSEKCSLSFMRKNNNSEDSLVVVANFANIPQEYTVGTNLPGKYKEVLSTDAKAFGGTNKVNSKAKAVSENASDGREYSFEIKLAPLSLSVFKYIPFTEKEKYQIEKKKEAAIADTKAKEYEALAASYDNEYEIAKKEMEEAKNRMKIASEKAREAKENANAEMEKAKKALEEAK